MRIDKQGRQLSDSPGKRVQTLASEKARLELLVFLMARLGKAGGLHQLVEQSLRILTDVIGSTNTSIYYQNEHRFHCADLFNKNRTMDRLDDPVVISAWNKRRPIQIESEFERTRMTYPTKSHKAFTWVYPMDTGDEVIGVIKFENTAYNMDEAGAQLDVVFRYLAQLLKNEIQNVKKLQAAYEKLKNSNAELENRVRDRTRDLERINRQLKQSQERFELAMNASQDGIFDWNLVTNDIYYSPGWKRMLGYGENELPNDFSIWETLTDPDDVKRSWEIQADVIDRKKDRFETEFRMKHKQGHWVDILSRAKAFFDDTGKAVRMIGTHVDISERKKAELALKSSEEKFALAFRGAPLLMTISAVDDGRYIDVNDTFIKTTGFTRKEAIGASSVELGFISETERKKLTAELSARGHVHELELALSRADGSELTCLYSGEMININGAPRLLSIAVDVTHRKKLEEQIQKSQKMESIGNLAGGIAHDFNNILFPIVGMSELLMEDLPKESQEYENAREIFKASKRGSELVKQILTFSRQSAHKRIPMRLQTVLNDALRLSRATIPAYIEIIDDIQTDCGLIMADPTQIQQVAMNLMTNAFHAVEAKGGKISVKMDETELEQRDWFHPDLTPGPYARLSISDTGHGMSADLIKKIFDPYFTTKEQGKGTGLGLAIVYGIVKKHKGEVRVSSEIGKGSTFTVYLPLLDRARDTDPIITTKNIRKGNERILLVDDEWPIANLEKQMLERMGYRVTACYHSLDAYQAFKASPDAFDLIVTDMAMPSMTGDQLAKKIQLIRPDIPIIICTGFSERIDKEKAAAMGIRGFLMKPVVRAEMAETVRQVLDRMAPKSGRSKSGKSQDGSIQ